MDDWVGELRLRVRSASPDTNGLRQGAEQLARTALERGAALLAARHPGRVLLVRRLPLHWKLEEEALLDDGQLEALACHVADLIERMAIPAGLVPPETAAAVLFDDEAQWRASHLLARAEGTTAWCHEALDDPSMGDALAVLADPARRAMAEATLAHLARAHRLAPVLASQPSAAVAVLAAALGCTSSGRLTDRNDGAAAPLMGDLPFPAAELAAVAAGWPPQLSPATRQLALRVHAAVLLDSPMDSAGVIALVAALAAKEPAAALQGAVAAEPAEVSKSAAKLSLPSPEKQAQLLANASDLAAIPDAEPLVSTRYAGLFYLCDRLQELDLPESLWKACLPEGQVLAVAATALLAPDGAGDPAAAILGGVERVSDCPDITLEQLAEVASTNLACLAAALSRRGLATIPAAVVALVERSAGRLLTVAAEGSPFAFFVWPADSPESIVTGLKLFLAAWPQGSALAAEPALVYLDSSGRLQPLTEASPQTLLLPLAASAMGTALLAMVVGAPCLLFAARADAPSLETVEGFVARYLQRSGRIRSDSERIEVVLDANQSDLAVRRAGLDRDPGWLPWLQRRMGFVFEDR